MRSWAIMTVASACWLLTTAAMADGEAARAQTMFVDAGDTRYAYRKIGSGGDTPLIMLTRYRANMDDWDPAFLDALAKERTVVLINQSGISSSSGVVPDTIAGMADDVANFVSAMGFAEVDVLGWSMGGFTAQVVAMNHADMVRKTILIGTGPAASPETPGPKEGVFDVATKDARSDGLTTYSDADRKYLFFSDEDDSIARAEASFARIDAARRDDEPVTGSKVTAAQTAAIQDFWFNPENGHFAGLAQMPDPVLIINGDNDAFFTIGAQELLYRQIPDARLAILPAAGHGPQHQQPDRVARMILEFLD